MKIILSRKGFDSKYGGYPSPIMPDGRMLSFPIPDPENIPDNVRYGDLKAGQDKTYCDLMKQLMPDIRYAGKKLKLRDTRCHLDPDIERSVMPRHKGWKACFGQVDAAQTHLKNQKVKEGDLFLFFGWFNELDKLKYNGVDIHAIFGYLQIGQIIKADRNYKQPAWMRHPHLLEKMRRKANNTIYIARDTLTWNSSLPGAGTLSFDPGLVLTKAGLTRSKWNLPEIFRNAKISYHSENSWEQGYFQSAKIGQEFVIQDNSAIENWARKLIEDNVNREPRRLRSGKAFHKKI